MNVLDQKINAHFPGLVVRKDLVKAVKGNAIVPSYVLEYLLGQYCATSDEPTIQTGIETVKEILRKHYVHRNEAGLVRSNIKEKGRYKVIDKISVALNEKTDAYEAEFSNLGIKKVLVDSDTVKAHPKLLVSGVWCICDIEYQFTEDKNSTPWVLSTLKPIQLSHFDFEAYLEARRQFSLDEWIDLLVQSMGFNPELFGRRSKLIQLVRLIPFCERNYNLIELGPKGTGKSHIFSEFSPHGILISDGYGFVVDYLAEILRSLRDHDFSDRYKDHFTLSSDISTRDRDGIHKTFSGLMKILFPQGGATSEEVEELLRFAMEGRKRVKDQLMRLDSTYADVAFHYSDNDGKDKAVTTLEEVEYPHHYHRTIAEAEPDVAGMSAQPGDVAGASEEKPEAAEPVEGPTEGHLTFSENQKGVSYDMLFGRYLRGAGRITVTDPYIRLFYQVRNFMELVETVVRHKESGEEVSIKLVTTEDDFKGEQQRDNLDKIKDACEALDIDFEWEFDKSGAIHARHLVTDTGWKISLDRGLDIFQHYEMNEAFAFANRMQQFRPCKAFEVTYIRQT